MRFLTGLEATLTHQQVGLQQDQPQFVRTRLSKKCADLSADVLCPLPWADVQPAVDSRALAFRASPGGWSTLELWTACSIYQRCQLMHKVGERTHGDVCVGKCLQEPTQIAVKVSKGLRAHRPLSSAEIALLGRALGHPNIVKLID